MNNVLDLFKGIGVIIDDALNVKSGNPNDIIWKIKSSFEKQNIPILTFSELPNNEQVRNFNTVSFMLLDWDLYGCQTELGVSKPQTAADDNIEFIKQFNSVCFAPIFIFSNDTYEIKNKLEKANLYDFTKSNHIFVESKSELKQSQILFTKIKKWITTTPSIYALKEWDKALLQAKCDLFHELHSINPKWAVVLQQTFKNDGVDENHELGLFIYKNLIARTIPIDFDKGIIPIFDFNVKDEKEKKKNQNKFNRIIKNVSKGDLRKILECERFLNNKKDGSGNNILPQNPATGDVFKNNKDYFINIRPDCDILRKGDDVILFCLKGEVVKEQNINAKKKSKIIFHNGELIEKNYNIYVSFIDEGKIIEFKFNKDLIQSKWSDLKSKHIGRLLPPYITRLQQKYAFYLQRQALPAIPEKAMK